MTSRKKPTIVKTRLTAYLPLLSPHRSDFRSSEFWDLLEELPRLSQKLDLSNYGALWQGLVFSVFDGRDKNQIASRNDRRFRKLWSLPEKSRARYVLKTTATAKFTESEAMTALKGSGIKRKDRLIEYKQFLQYPFEDVLNDFIVLANLSRPGLLEIGRGYIFQDGRLVKMTDVIINELRMALAHASKIGWPQHHTLDLILVWNWALRHKLLGGIGNSPLGRAFNAFSYLFFEPSDDQTVLLFWSLIGLEALYVSSATNIMDQVRERSQIFLGPLEAYKKKLSRMYDVRSKFIHGALPFPGKFFSSDALPEYEQFMDDVGQASLLAQAVLTASLQEMVRQGRGELNFKTTLSAQRA